MKVSLLKSFHPLLGVFCDKHFPFLGLICEFHLKHILEEDSPEDFFQRV